MHISPPQMFVSWWTKVCGFYTRSSPVQSVQKSGKRPVQFAEKTLVLAPGTVDGNVQIEEDLGAENGLQFDPRFGADPLDHVAALSDDDRLLRLALDDDRRVDLDEVFVLFLFPAIDRHCRRVG